MDTRTRYLGLDLPHPFVVGASPLGDSVDSAKRMEDAGAAAVVMRSLFQEQIDAEAMATHMSTEVHAESHGEASSYFPSPEEFVMGPDEYLERLCRTREALNVPVIGSLNGTTLGGWLSHALLIEEAGVDGLELNIYDVPMDATRSAGDIEDTVVEMVSELKAKTNLPLAIKLSPFYTSMAHFAGRLEEAGADSLVLFNRYFEPDVDIEELRVTTQLQLSTSSELALRLRWLAVLSPIFGGSLAVTGGVHTATDAIKALMCGADAVQMVSVLLHHGPARIGENLLGLRRFLKEAEYESLDQMRGSMNLDRCPNPEAYKRANYMRVLQTWSPLKP
ncbi:MAG: dihydroorotate dehydrogenase-like protein [Candidatus Eisenbacteria bacterium]|uniref:Dihydroorotate dehydrogenase-like protein n=1 Tax=Eiseniibacteriota bacterium TaxID=2212470 RepID=A0A7Y2E9Y5_UNCEI|nr:dihydroorotate dehydrogenase-like protein [Candidatus Eisenbacteria bacterium]